MKILYYIEPHPIRNGYMEFLWIAREILAMIERSCPWNSKSEQGFEIKIHGNPHVIRSLVQMKPWMRSYLLDWEECPGKAELESWFMPWGEEAIGVWKDLMTGAGEISGYYKSNLDSVRNRYDFDVLVHWGTNGAVENFCNAERILKISMESGYLRLPFMDSVVFDPRGVNGNSSICEVDMDLLCSLTEPRDADYDLRLIGCNNASTGPLSQRFELIRSVHSPELYKDGKIALIALQLRDDSNMILFSEFGSSVDFLRQVLPPLLEQGYRCVIKPHPAAGFREINRKDHESAAEYVAGFEAAIWCDDVRAPSQQVALLERADLVVTTNSSLGFEATLLDKKVCLEGTAAYAPRGVFPSVAEYLSGDHDDGGYLEKLRYLRPFLITNMLHEKTDAFDFSYFCNQVAGGIHTWHEAGKDPAEFCKRIRAFQTAKLCRQLVFMKYGKSTPSRMEWDNETMKLVYDIMR